MNRTMIGSILGTVAVVVVSIVTAAMYVARLEERVKNLEIDSQQQENRTNIAIRTFANTPRPRGSQVGFANSGSWGVWSDPQFCPDGYYVCGLKQKVEPRQGDGDDSAMNAVAFYCCPLDPQAEPNASQ